MLKSSGLCRYVVWWKNTDSKKDLPPSTVRYCLPTPYTRIYRVTSKKTVIFIVTYRGDFESFIDCTCLVEKKAEIRNSLTSSESAVLLVRQGLLHG
jgi:hypothetical protein